MGSSRPQQQGVRRARVARTQFGALQPHAPHAACISRFICARSIGTDAGRSSRRISRRAASATSVSVGSTCTDAPPAWCPRRQVWTWTEGKDWQPFCRQRSEQFDPLHAGPGGHCAPGKSGVATLHGVRADCVLDDDGECRPHVANDIAQLESAPTLQRLKIRVPDWAIDPFRDRFRQQQQRFPALEDRIESEIQLSGYKVLERSSCAPNWRRRALANAENKQERSADCRKHNERQYAGRQDPAARVNHGADVDR